LDDILISQTLVDSGQNYFVDLGEEGCEYLHNTARNEQYKWQHVYRTQQGSPTGVRRLAKYKRLRVTTKQVEIEFTFEKAQDFKYSKTPRGKEISSVPNGVKIESVPSK